MARESSLKTAVLNTDSTPPGELFMKELMLQSNGNQGLELREVVLRQVRSHWSQRMLAQQ